MAILTVLVDKNGVEVLAGSAIEVNDLLAQGLTFKGTGQVPAEPGPEAADADRADAEQVAAGTPVAAAGPGPGTITSSDAPTPPTREGTA